MAVAVGAIVAVGAVAAVAGVRWSSDDGPDIELHAELQSSTLFETRRALRLQMSADSDRDVRLGAVQLRSPLFEPVDAETRDPVLRADRGAIVFPLRYGAARCGDHSPDEDGHDPAELVTEVDGEEVRVEVAQRPPGLLTELHAAECAAEAVRDVVDLRLGEAWELTGPRTARGEIELALRDAGGSAHLDEVEGNMIFGVGPADDAEPDGGSGSAGTSGSDAGGDPSGDPSGDADPGGGSDGAAEAGGWLEVDDARPSASMDIVVTAGRCDPHAVAEYKRTFVFTAWVRVGEAEPVRVDLPADGAARRALEELLTGCVA
jgi:hypothetical protein